MKLYKRKKEKTIKYPYCNSWSKLWVTVSSEMSREHLYHSISLSWRVGLQTVKDYSRALQKFTAHSAAEHRGSLPFLCMQQGAWVLSLQWWWCVEGGCQKHQWKIKCAPWTLFFFPVAYKMHLCSQFYLLPELLTLRAGSGQEAYGWCSRQHQVLWGCDAQLQWMPWKGVLLPNFKQYDQQELLCFVPAENLAPGSSLSFNTKLKFWVK